jgi:hypothetical protein
MNGPNVVCAGCGAPTSIYAPLCTECARNYVALVGEIPPVCPLCNSSLYGEPKIKPADKFGIHYTMTGGYAGKCSAASITGDDL